MLALKSASKGWKADFPCGQLGENQTATSRVDKTIQNGANSEDTEKDFNLLRDKIGEERRPIGYGRSTSRGVDRGFKRLLREGVLM